MRKPQVCLGIMAAVLAAVAVDGATDTVPRVYQFDGRRIAEIRERVGRGDAELVAALKSLRRDADRLLTTTLQTVVDKPDAPPSGDKHDYTSFAPYFWPDCSKPNGLPYIRKDGQRNEEEVKKYDAPRLNRLNSAVLTLALAYALTDEPRYAERAAFFLRAWFLDPMTRMNPNLRFGQFVPGRNDGRATGIIETRGLFSVVDAAGLIEGSRDWTAQDGEGLRAWFRAYLAWLRTSDFGKAEDATVNNHGTWYDAQVVTFALYVGDDATARQVLEQCKTRRIATQIEPDGTQPKELIRNNSFDYCAFNIDAFATLADLGGKASVDLWHETTADGRSITRALDFLIPFATGDRPWPYLQDGPMKRKDLLLPLRRAALALSNATYDDAFRKITAGGASLDPIPALLHPPAPARR